jgi:hypothetical protein
VPARFPGLRVFLVCNALHIVTGSGNALLSARTSTQGVRIAPFSNVGWFAHS